MHESRAPGSCLSALMRNDLARDSWKSNGGLHLPTTHSDWCLRYLFHNAVYGVSHDDDDDMLLLYTHMSRLSVQQYVQFSSSSRQCEKDIFYAAKTKCACPPMQSWSIALTQQLSWFSHTCVDTWVIVMRSSTS